MMNPKILYYVKTAREKLPMAKLGFMTNGTLLTVEKLKTLCDYVNEVNITEHTGKFNPVIGEFMEKYPFLSNKVKYVFFPNGSTKIFNRGGLLSEDDLKDLKGERFTGTSRCEGPSKMLEINHKGDVVLCCQDYLGQYVFGNVNEERLEDIWFKNNMLNRLRKELFVGMFRLDICRKCVGIVNNKYRGRKMTSVGKWVSF